MVNFDKDEFFENYVSFEELMDLAEEVPVGSIEQYPAEYPRADAVAQILVNS